MDNANLEIITRFSREAEKAAGLLKVLSNEQRLLILCHLSEEGELSVGQLCDRLGLSQSALSQHLAKLREKEIVATRKLAKTILFSVGDALAFRVLSLLNDVFCPELGRAAIPIRTGNHD
jgi:ArsR family transcriptional regulator